MMVSPRRTRLLTLDRPAFPPRDGHNFAPCQGSCPAVSEQDLNSDVKRHYHLRHHSCPDRQTLHVSRCVRPDEVSAQVRCHYLTDGTANFAFTIRRSEYFIPAGVLLKCFLETTDREIFARLVSSAPKVRVVPQSGGAAVFHPQCVVPHSAAGSCARILDPELISMQLSATVTGAMLEMIPGWPSS